MRRCIFFIIFGVCVVTGLNAQFYSDSARSTAMNGAHSAVTCDGFEAMLFNPAGLAASQSKFGLHILGTLGLNLYSNCFNMTTVVEVLEQFQGGDNSIEHFVSDMQAQSFFSEFQTGLAMNYNLFKFFFHTKRVSLGFSDTVKMRARMFIGDDLFSTVFNEINLNKNQSLGTIDLDLMVYNDFCATFSMYLWMLERKTPFKGVYLGGGIHWYIPMVHASAEFSGKLGKGSLGEKIDVSQVDANLYTYNLELDGKVSLASPAASSWDFLGIPQLGNLSNGEGVPLGFGADLGVLIDFNNWVRAGLSVTDLGFMMSPSTEIEVHKKINLDLQKIGDIGSEFSGIADDVMNGGKGGYEIILAPATARVGFTFIPLLSRYMDVECPLTFTVTDFDLIPSGLLPTFGVSTGLDLLIKAGFFQLPLWTSVGYFTSSGFSWGVGTGLHLGVWHLDLGVRGLESLFAPPSNSGWGRDIAFAMQMSFQLKKKKKDK